MLRSHRSDAWILTRPARPDITNQAAGPAIENCHGVTAVTARCNLSWSISATADYNLQVSICVTKRFGSRSL